MSRWTAVRLEEISILDDGRTPMRPVRHHLGMQAVGVNVMVPRGPGESAVNEHDEADTGDEELYLVLSGHAAFTVDGDEIDAPAGTLVFVEPAATRGAVAKEEGTTILAIGAPAGKPYRPSGWEVQAEAMTAFRAGDYERAIELLEPLAREHSEYAGIPYNLACAEALGGKPEAALGHLAEAIRRDESFRDFARGDSDFDAIRSDPRFAELVGATG